MNKFLYFALLIFSLNCFSQNVLQICQTNCELLSHTKRSIETNFECHVRAIKVQSNPDCYRCEVRWKNSGQIFYNQQSFGDHITNKSICLQNENSKDEYYQTRFENNYSNNHNDNKNDDSDSNKEEDEEDEEDRDDDESDSSDDDSSSSNYVDGISYTWKAIMYIFNSSDDENIKELQKIANETLDQFQNKINKTLNKNEEKIKSNISELENQIKSYNKELGLDQSVNKNNKIIKSMEEFIEKNPIKESNLDPMGLDIQEVSNIINNNDSFKNIANDLKNSLTHQYHQEKSKIENILSDSDFKYQALDAINAMDFSIGEGILNSRSGRAFFASSLDGLKIYRTQALLNESLDNEFDQLPPKVQDDIMNLEKLITFHKTHQETGLKQEILQSKLNNNEFSDHVNLRSNLLSQSKNLQEMALTDLSDGHIENAQIAQNYSLEAIDLGLSLTPGVGVAKDLIELISEENIVTGKSLSTTDKVLAAVGVVSLWISNKDM